VENRKRAYYEARLGKEGLVPLGPVGRSRGERRDQITNETTGAVLFELDESEVDLRSQYRGYHHAKYGPEVRGDGDDHGTKPARDTSWSKLPAKTSKDNAFEASKIDPSKRHTYDTVQVQRKPLDNSGGQMLEDCHGFLIDQGTKPWKTARRTHCRQCGSEFDPPDVSKFRCEFDPEEAACKCNTCTERALMLSRHARGVGQPRTYCGDECRRQWQNAVRRHETAVNRALKRGTEPPAPPEDQGLKMVRRAGPASSVEGNGHRYVSANRGVVQ
jgi:hypothetical protein